MIDARSELVVIRSSTRQAVLRLIVGIVGVATTTFIFLLGHQIIPNSWNMDDNRYFGATPFAFILSLIMLGIAAHRFYGKIFVSPQGVRVRRLFWNAEIEAEQFDQLRISQNKKKYFDLVLAKDPKSTMTLLPDVQLKADDLERLGRFDFVDVTMRNPEDEF